MTPWLFWSFWQQSFGPRSFMDMWVLQVNHHHNCCHLHHHHHTWDSISVILVYNVTPGSQTLIGPFLDKDSHASNNFAIKQVFCFLWCKTPSPLSICFIEILIRYTISFCIYIWKVDGLLVLQHKHLCSGGGSLCNLSCYRHKGESQDSQNEPFFVFLANIL